ncbi:MAG TPA: NADH:flavin oxidoreductase [Nitrospirota bacterium]|nr:NADH:flavin oxidoreductase [Nitrospirota bacterium]
MKQSLLFSQIQFKGLALKNRITMAPLFLSYANPDGTANELIIDYYREMAASGAAMIVTENVAVAPSGMGSPFTLLSDDDRYIADLAKIAKVIRQEGAVAICQLNHAGRYAHAAKQRLAPSPVKTGEVLPKEMNREEIETIIKSYADAAARVKEAGFDGVELHGGTGYLLVQFLSQRTNLRKDEYGGPLENRMKFPLRVVEAVIKTVGNYPVGYRFLADEWLPDGLHTDQTSLYAKELAKRGIAYLSVMAGTYDSFFLPSYREKEKEEAYMVHFAGSIKEAVPGLPVIAAGRIQTPETAEKVLREGTADLIGLARVLFADPLWPKKAAGKVDKPIVKCLPTCNLCMELVMKGKPAFCAHWDKKKRARFISIHGK